MQEHEKLVYAALNKAVCNEIGDHYKKILDIGCGSGELGSYLKSRTRDRLVHGVTYSEKEYSEAKRKVDNVFLADLNKADEFHAAGPYDCIICSHVLEHLYDPQSLLVRLKDSLSPDGRLIVALPNVLFFQQRLKFLAGHFKYSENGGLMDVTHFRFFDWQSAQALLSSAGYVIESKKADGHFPLPLLRKVALLARAVDDLMVSKFPGLFGFQFVFVAKVLGKS